MVYFWGVLAAVAAVLLEGMYARAPQFVSFPLVFALAIAQPTIAYSIYRMVHESTTLIGAVVVFGFSTLVLRTAMTIYLGQHISTGTWIALALVFLAQIARRF